MLPQTTGAVSFRRVFGGAAPVKHAYDTLISCVHVGGDRSPCKGYWGGAAPLTAGEASTVTGMGELTSLSPETRMLVRPGCSAVTRPRVLTVATSGLDDSYVKRSGWTEPP